jgi:hypothetical protein
MKLMTTVIIILDFLLDCLYVRKYSKKWGHHKSFPELPLRDSYELNLGTFVAAVLMSSSNHLAQLNISVAC